MAAFNRQALQDDDMFTPDASGAEDSPLPGLVIADDIDSAEDESGKNPSLRCLVENVIHCLEEDSQDTQCGTGVGKESTKKQKSMNCGTNGHGFDADSDSSCQVSKVQTTSKNTQTVVGVLAESEGEEDFEKNERDGRMTPGHHVDSEVEDDLESYVNRELAQEEFADVGDVPEGDSVNDLLYIHKKLEDSPKLDTTNEDDDQVESETEETDNSYTKPEPEFKTKNGDSSGEENEENVAEGVNDGYGSSDDDSVKENETKVGSVDSNSDVDSHVAKHEEEEISDNGNSRDVTRETRDKRDYDNSDDNTKKAKHETDASSEDDLQKSEEDMEEMTNKTNEKSEECSEEAKSETRDRSDDNSEDDLGKAEHETDGGSEDGVEEANSKSKETAVGDSSEGEQSWADSELSDSDTDRRKSKRPGRNKRKSTSLSAVSDQSDGDEFDDGSSDHPVEISDANDDGARVDDGDDGSSSSSDLEENRENGGGRHKFRGRNGKFQKRKRRTSDHPVEISDANDDGARVDDGDDGSSSSSDLEENRENGGGRHKSRGRNGKFQKRKRRTSDHPVEISDANDDGARVDDGDDGSSSSSDLEENRENGGGRHKSRGRNGRFQKRKRRTPTKRPSCEERGCSPMDEDSFIDVEECKDSDNEDNPHTGGKAEFLAHSLRNCDSDDSYDEEGHRNRRKTLRKRQKKNYFEGSAYDDPTREDKSYKPERIQEVSDSCDSGSEEEERDPKEKRISKLFIGVKGTLGLQIGEAHAKTFYNLIICETKKTLSMYMVPLKKTGSSKVYTVLPSDGQNWELTQNDSPDLPPHVVTHRYQSKGRKTLKLVESDAFLEPDQVKLLENLVPANRSEVNTSKMEVKYFHVLSPKHAVKLLVKDGIQDFFLLKKITGCLALMMRKPTKTTSGSWDGNPMSRHISDKDDVIMMEDEDDDGSSSVSDLIDLDDDVPLIESRIPDVIPASVVSENRDSSSVNKSKIIPSVSLQKADNDSSGTESGDDPILDSSTGEFRTFGAPLPSSKTDISESKKPPSPCNAEVSHSVPSCSNSSSQSSNIQILDSETGVFKDRNSNSVVPSAQRVASSAPLATVGVDLAESQSALDSQTKIGEKSNMHPVPPESYVDSNIQTTYDAADDSEDTISVGSEEPPPVVAAESGSAGVHPIFMFTREEASLLSGSKGTTQTDTVSTTSGLSSSVAEEVELHKSDSTGNTQAEPTNSLAGKQTVTDESVRDNNPAKSEDDDLDIKIGFVFSLASDNNDLKSFPESDTETIKSLKAATLEDSFTKQEVDTKLDQSSAAGEPVVEKLRQKLQSAKPVCINVGNETLNVISPIDIPNPKHGTSVPIGKEIAVKIVGNEQIVKQHTNTNYREVKVRVPKTHNKISVPNSNPNLLNIRPISSGSGTTRPTLSPAAPKTIVIGGGTVGQQPRLNCPKGTTVLTTNPQSTAYSAKVGGGASPQVIRVMPIQKFGASPAPASLPKWAGSQAAKQPQPAVKILPNPTQPTATNTFMLQKARPGNTASNGPGSLVAIPVGGLSQSKGKAIATNVAVDKNGVKYCLLSLDSGQKFLVPLPPAQKIQDTKVWTPPVDNAVETFATKDRTAKITDHGIRIEPEAMSNTRLSETKGVDTTPTVIRIKKEPQFRGYSDETEVNYPPLKKIKTEPTDKDYSVSLIPKTMSASVNRTGSVERKRVDNNPLPSKLIKTESEDPKNSKEDRISRLKRLLKEKEIALEQLRHKTISPLSPGTSGDPTKRDVSVLSEYRLGNFPVLLLGCGAISGHGVTRMVSLRQAKKGAAPPRTSTSPDEECVDNGSFPL
ncbi:hypothetical protein ScPMuIL_012686 [Solemya velum]